MNSNGLGFNTTTTIKNDPADSKTMLSISKARVQAILQYRSET
jgi:hypothetical protein